MMTVVFVHGINTRGADFNLAFDRIRAALADRCPEVALAPCCWGDDLGATLRGGGQSVPRYDQTKGFGEVGGEAVEEADLWGGGPLGAARPRPDGRAAPAGTTTRPAAGAIQPHQE
jgi:hypothetical protein